jgi:hypothetical protein
MGHVGPSVFSIVPRPQYHPNYGPIKYKIREVMDKLWLKKEEDLMMNRLEQEIMIAANQTIHLILRLYMVVTDGIE